MTSDTDGTTQAAPVDYEGRRFGIDLGTTYSSISYFDRDNNRVETVDLSSIADGQRAARSVVYYPGPGQNVVVGEVAWNAKKQFPDRVFDGIKRSMGLPGYKTVPVDGREYTAQEISAEILKALARDALPVAGQEVTDVVITVPAYFGDPQLAATEESGRAAGFNVLALLPEPHAAALAYSIAQAVHIVDKYLLVYDLGGGTFDVTLCHASTSSDAKNALNLKIDTIYKAGNAQLGGLDWDNALAELVDEKMQQQHSMRIREDAKNDAFLLDNCEKAKRYLSQASPATILADMGGMHQIEVTRAEFEDRTRDLLMQTKMLLEEVLEKAEKEHGVPRDKIQVMLSGGSSKMPMVEQMIKATTGKEPLKYGNPDLLVTIGAAYYAHLLGGGSIKAGVKTIKFSGITDTAPQSVGITVMRPDGRGGKKPCNSVLLPAGTVYGAKSRIEKEFYKTETGMTEVDIILTSSAVDTENPDDCKELGNFQITGLPADGKAGDPVRISIEYDNNGVLQGTAMDVKTGKDVRIVIDRQQITG